MNKFTMAAITALMCTSTIALAQDAMKQDKMMHDNMKMDMKAMDANSDGMISNEEYMKSDGATAEHWATMKKNKGGMVSMKDMKKDHMMMMKKDGMMKDGKMMKDGSGH